MQKHNKFQSIPAICGALMISVIVLSGCGQKDTDASSAAPPSPPATSPAPAASPSTAASTSAAAVPKGGADAHRATLQAQSDYWRKHGQGLNETPTPKSKQ